MNIDIDEDFPEHPKTLRFCGLIGNPLGWAYVWRLWRFCAKYRPDGDLTRLDPAEIEAGVGWTALDGRFFAAAVKAGFIDQDDRGARVHDWMQHMGAGLIRMEVDRLRKASSRAAKGGDKEEAGRLDGVIAALRKRLSTVGSRTSDGRPADFHGTAPDVHRTSDGQVPNGGGLPSNGDGHPSDVHRMSGVSALLCSALPCSDLPPRAGDPTEQEPVAPPPAPAEGATIHPLPSPPKLTGYDLVRLYGDIRGTRVKGALPWSTPVSSDGKAETFAERLSPDEAADVRATMEIHFAELTAGEGKAGALENPTFGFGCWSGDFTRLREKLHGKGPREPKAAAPPPTRPRWTGQP